MANRVFTRRGFVAGSSLAAALLAVSTGSAATLAQGGGSARLKGQPLPDGVRLPSARDRRIRPDSVGFAIVGLGGYALNQMMPRFAQAERAHIAAIVSGNTDKLHRVGDAYGVPADARYSYDAFEKIASDKRIDAVYIVLPTGLHAEWAIRGFAAGKHVLCEKPMALTSADCERMIAAARKVGRKLMIAYRSHFEPYNLEAMRLMEQKALGTIQAGAHRAVLSHGAYQPPRELANQSRAGGRRSARRLRHLRTSSRLVSHRRNARADQRHRVPIDRRSALRGDFRACFLAMAVPVRRSGAADDVL